MAKANSRTAGALKFPEGISKPCESLRDSPYQNVRTDKMMEARRASTNTTSLTIYPAEKLRYVKIQTFIICISILIFTILCFILSDLREQQLHLCRLQAILAIIIANIDIAII